LKRPQLLPDGKTLLSCTREEVRWTEAATGRRIKSWRLPEKWEVCGFSADGRLALLRDQANLRLWNIETKKALPFSKSLDSSGRKKSAVLLIDALFSADAKTLAITAFPTLEGTLLRVWDIETGRELWRDGEWDAPAKRHVLGFLPDGNALLVADREKDCIRLRDRATGEERRSFATKPLRPFPSHCLSPDGKTLLLDTFADTVRAWDVTTGKELPALAGHENKALPLAFSRDGNTLLTLGRQRVVFVWDWPSSKLRRKIDLGPGRPIYSCAVSADGERVEVLRLAEPAMRFFDIATGREIPTQPEAHRGGVSSLVTTPDGKLLSGSADYTLRVWDVHTGRQLQQFSSEPPFYPSMLSLSADCRLFANAHGEKGRVELHDRETGRLVRAIETGLERIHGIAFAPESRLLAVSGHRLPDAGGFENFLIIWDAEIGRQVRSFEEVADGGPAFSPDGRLIAGVGRGGESIKLFDVATGKVRHELPTDNWPNLTFSPDGRTLAVANSEALVLWEVATGKERRRIQRKRSERVTVYYPDILCFSPDGRWLASVNPQERFARLHNSLGQEVHRFIGHEDNLSCLAFTADSSRLATGSADTTILLWDVGSLRAGQRQQQPVTSDQAKSAWNELRNPNAKTAYESMEVLSNAPAESLPLLRERLKPLPTPDWKQVERWLASLSGDVFSERDKATRELQRLGDSIEGALQRFLANTTSPEAQRRVERLLARLENRPLDPEQLQFLRALEILEHINTPEARNVLKSLAGGAPDARLTREAKAALDRLNRRCAK
jgi:WD40 repeat protein